MQIDNNLDDLVFRPEKKEPKESGYKVFASIVIYIINFVISGYLAAWAWNMVIANIFGLPMLTFWQVYAISLAKSIWFTPRQPDLDKSFFEFVLQDLIYTLLSTGFLYLIVMFAL